WRTYSSAIRAVIATGRFLSDYLRRCELFGMPEDAARLRFREFTGKARRAHAPSQFCIPIRVPTHSRNGMMHSKRSRQRSGAIKAALPGDLRIDDPAPEAVGSASIGTWNQIIFGRGAGELTGAAEHAACLVRNGTSSGGLHSFTGCKQFRLREL